MADTFRDPFDDNDSGNEDGGRPPTPEIHHGGEVDRNTTEEDRYSDISDSGEDEVQINREKRVETSEEIYETKSVNEEERPSERFSSQEHILDKTSHSPISPVSVGEENEHDSFPSSDNLIDKSSLKGLEESESFQHEEFGEGDRSLRRDAGVNLETIETKVTKSVGISDEKILPLGDESFETVEEISVRENSEEALQQVRDSMLKSEDEELLMSPIGDLGMSEHEAAIVDDILKDDVGKYLPHVDGEAEVDRNEISDSDSNYHKESESLMEVDDESSSKKDKIQEVDKDQDEENEEKSEVKEKEVEEAGPSETSADKEQQIEEESEDEEAGEQLIADIFGASDEEEEFEGFGQEDIEVTKKKKGALEKKKKSAISDDEDEDVSGPGLEALIVPAPAEESSDEDEMPTKAFVSDFDEMMQKKKEMNRANRRRKKDYDIINDNDDIICAMIKKMKEAAEEDRMLNEAKQAATKKLKMLPTVLRHMNKADLQCVLLDSGILPALKEWLTPLPDGSLPHLQIRDGLLKTLAQFPAIDTGALKMSGLGKAIMYLYRHPKEIRKNRDVAGKLINEWARPIFGVTANFKSMSREEREERDYQLMPKRRRLSSTDEGGRTPKSIDNALQGEKKALRPGDKGFVMRARVPIPSTRDYVVRPKWNQERMEFSKKPVKTMNRFQKQFRKFKDRKQMMDKGDQRAVQISIEGRNMSL